MKRIIIIFFLLFGIYCCDKIDETDINFDLIGEWTWIRTDGGIAYHIHENPETTNQLIHLELANNYKFKLVENGNEISKGTYKLSLGKSVYSEELDWNIKLSGNYQNQNIVLNGIINVFANDTLTISDNYYDGIVSAFVKEK